MSVEIIIILILILLNGIFSMSEIAVISSRRSKLKHDAERGDKNARRALALSKSPGRFLSTVQVGITLIGILTGVFGGTAATERAELFFNRFDITAPYSHSLAVTLVVIIITFLTLVFGELVPKRLGMTRPEKIAKRIVGPMNALSRIASPLVWLLSATTEGVVKLFRIRPSEDSRVTEDEIKALIAEGTHAGTVEVAEQDIMERVFHLGDRKIGSLMTNRRDIIWLDLNDDFEMNKKKIIDSSYAALPLCDGELDKVKGILRTKKILHLLVDNGEFELTDHLSPVLYLPENMKTYSALDKFKETGNKFALVTDEYGSAEGIVTMNDLLGALVSDVTESDEGKLEIIERKDGTVLMDALVPFDDFALYFDLKDTDKDTGGGFHTLGGLIFDIAKHIPKTGQTFTWRNFELEVIDMDGNRIDKILVKQEKEG